MPISSIVVDCGSFHPLVVQQTRLVPRHSYPQEYDDVFITSDVEYFKSSERIILKFVTSNSFFTKDKANDDAYMETPLIHSEVIIRLTPRLVPTLLSILTVWIITWV